jgi:hypothetical protein
VKVVGFSGEDLGLLGGGIAHLAIHFRDRGVEQAAERRLPRRGRLPRSSERADLAVIVLPDARELIEPEWWRMENGERSDLHG